MEIQLWMRSRHIRLMPAMHTPSQFKVQELTAGMKTGLHTRLFVDGSVQLRPSVPNVALPHTASDFHETHRFQYCLLLCCDCDYAQI